GSGPLSGFRPGQRGKHAGDRPILFLVDDESRNREWFARAHRESFCVVSFSGRSHFKAALDKKFPVDAVVTDLFFPRIPPVDEKAAADVLGLYEQLENCPFKDVPAVWARDHRSRWSLEGFDIARDVVEVNLQNKRQIPV